MIYEFTVENFRSFGEAQTLTLVKGRERNKPENLTSGPEGFPQAVRVAAIFGHNASGKSNLVRAAQVFVNIVRNSGAVIYPNNQIPGIEPHLLSRKWAPEPCRFEIVFPTDARVFRYSFSASAQRINKETLIEELASGKQRPVFTRQTDAANQTKVEFHAEHDFENIAREQIAKLTRETSLVVSSGANLNVPLLRLLYDLIVGRALFLGLSHLPFDPGTHLANLLRDDTALREQLRVFLRDADVGIKDIRIPHEPADEAQISSLADQLRPREGEKAERTARQLIELATRRVRSVHRATDGREMEFEWRDESWGTQLFAVLFCHLAAAAKNGWTVIVDEFGSNVHPLLAERLLEWFQSPTHHPAAQLILATHATPLLTPRLLRKDQIWFTEKISSGESRLACLADFRGKNAPRSTEAFERNYLSGVYGGVADFGAHLSGVPYGEEEPDEEKKTPAGGVVQKP
jgi:AAA15 family ATPase/GTPase